MTLSLLLASGAAGVAPPAARASTVFDRADTAYMSMTPTGEATSMKKGTFVTHFKPGRLGAAPLFWAEGADQIALDASNRLTLTVAGTTHTLDVVCLDMTGWSQLHVAIDTTQGTAANRIVVTLNGMPLSFTVTVAQNAEFAFGGNGLEQRIGYNGTSYWDGKIGLTHWIDGQALAASAFGAFNADNSNVWEPIGDGSFDGVYGNGGFKLAMLNSGSLGADTSGNGNHFTLTNIAAGDQSVDVMTDNHCIWNVWSGAAESDVAVHEGGREANIVAASDRCNGTHYFDIEDSEGFYFEYVVTAVGTTLILGISHNHTDRQSATVKSNEWGYRSSDGQKINNNVGAAYGATYTTADVIGVAIKGGALWFSKNGTWQNSATASEIAAGTTTNAAYSSLTGFVAPWAMSTSGAPVVRLRTEAAEWSGTAPTGLKALKVKAQQEPTVSQPNLAVEIVPYTGNGASTRKLSATFQPGFFVSGKPADGYVAFDSARGAGKHLRLEHTTTENSLSNTLKSFDSDGVTLGSNADVNQNGLSYWGWLMKVGSFFQPVLYAGSGSGQDVTHGHSAKPVIAVIKPRNNGTHEWSVYADTPTLGATNYLRLNTGETVVSDATVFDAEPDTSIVSVGSNAQADGSSFNFILWSFVQTTGAFAAGEYTGTGFTTNAFIHCGFKPLLVIIKRVNGGTGGWLAFDSRTTPQNLNGQAISRRLDANQAEQTTFVIHLLSNGFIVRETADTLNNSGDEFIWLAWAEAHAGSKILPCATAR